MLLENCWSNLIGIKSGCDDGTPESNYYIEDLPEIGDKLAAAVMKEDDESISTFLRGRINFAKKKLIDKIRSKIAPNMQVLSSLDTDTIGVYRKNQDIEPAIAGKYWGIRVRYNTYPYLKFNLHRIGILLDANTTANVKIFNVLTGKQEGTDIQITAIANEVTYVEVNQEYYSQGQELDLFIAVDSATGNAYKADLHRNFLFGSCGRCDGYSTRFTRFTAVESDNPGTPIESNLKGINHTGGLTLDYATSCSVESYICNQGANLALPLLYASGIEILREAMYSSNINSVVNIQANINKALRKELEDQFDESLSNYLENWVPPNDICFSCDPRVGLKVVLP